MRKRWTMWAVPVAFVCAGAALAQDAPQVELAPVANAIDVEAANDVEVANDIEVANEGEALCGDVTTEADVVVNALAAAAPGVCKPCKDRTWCKCTYNGNPRASCDPCCYRTYAGTLVCFD